MFVLTIKIVFILFVIGLALSVGFFLIDGILLILVLRVKNRDLNGLFEMFLRYLFNDMIMFLVSNCLPLMMVINLNEQSSFLQNVRGETVQTVTASGSFQVLFRCINLRSLVGTNSLG